jgi:hypothetical protein
VAARTNACWGMLEQQRRAFGAGGSISRFAFLSRPRTSPVLAIASAEQAIHLVSAGVLTRGSTSTLRLSREETVFLSRRRFSLARELETRIGRRPTDVPRSCCCVNAFPTGGFRVRKGSCAEMGREPKVWEVRLSGHDRIDRSLSFLGRSDLSRGRWIADRRIVARRSESKAVFHRRQRERSRCSNSLSNPSNVLVVTSYC